MFVTEVTLKRRKLKMDFKNETYRELFTKPAEELAQWLLGKIICHRVHDEHGDFTICGRISVTEAYREKDDVTDAVRENGKTNSQLKSGGHLYVAKENRVKGGHRFDIVANQEGVGEGVLIRGIESYEEGPCIAAWALDIDKHLDGIDLLNSNEIWIKSDGVKIIQNEPTPRKNLSENASDESKNALLRFTIKEIKFSK